MTSFARAIEKALSNEVHDDGWCIRKGRQASNFILSTYRPEREPEEVVRALEEMNLSQIVEQQL